MFLERGHVELKKESDYPKVDYDAYKKRIEEASIHERDEKIKAFVGEAEYIDKKNAYTPPSDNEVKIKYWHGEWIKANFHPISAKKLDTFMDEREWLLNKGLFIDGNEIKSL